ncbi:MAG: hypothetical protein KKD94_06315 [Nanoarchaeota archaeon]|nr:hypothetical protein [Nanoarchaeota archaeon]MBU1989063.1 hypothetical protein [Nanoarchaeota archaeon]
MENSQIIQVLIILGLFILSTLPLHKAVKILKGKTKFYKTVFIVIISGTLISLINTVFSVWAGLIAFIFLIWIYRKAFKLKWHKAVVVWALHLAFIIMSSVIIKLVLDTFTKVSLYLR